MNTTRKLSQEFQQFAIFMCLSATAQSLWLLLSNYSRQGAIVNCDFENGGDSMNEGGECGDATKKLQICLLRTEIGGWESGSS